VKHQVEEQAEDYGLVEKDQDPGIRKAGGDSKQNQANGDKYGKFFGGKPALFQIEEEKQAGSAYEKRVGKSRIISV
jgi:hypothetical protein